MNGYGGVFKVLNIVHKVLNIRQNRPPKLGCLVLSS
jgi:hypothetical protein